MFGWDEKEKGKGRGLKIGWLCDFYSFGMKEKKGENGKSYSKKGNE